MERRREIVLSFINTAVPLRLSSPRVRASQAEPMAPVTVVPAGARAATIRRLEMSLERFLPGAGTVKVGEVIECLQGQFLRLGNP